LDFQVWDNVTLLGEQMAAQNNVNIGVNISDNGTANRTLKNVQELHSELKATQKTAAKTGLGGTPGSKAVYAKSAPTGSESVMSGQDYGRARGSAGSTGAGARDFANQAQGLGGLVRIYATFAANLFAVSAAFGALKNAADTTNMVKGLDQLGAQSGRSLGTLAQDLVKATDGAVSLREAMTATAQTTAAGMTSENLKRLAAGARNVSQALGVAMPDALSRLSRGITKLEPELLDELGIFVRVDDAAQKYARSIGKTTANLTDFEKRGAFAAEVLTQLEEKFGAINLQANPYDQLLASLKNVAQTGLEVVNKVLGPLIKILAESPTGLATALAAVSAILLKQAIPELGAMKKRMADQATQAREIANIKVAEAQKGLAKEVAANKIAAANAADARVAAVDEAETKLKAIIARSNEEVKKSAKEVFKVLNKESIQAITDEDIAKINKLAQSGGKVGQAYTEIATAIKKSKDAEAEHDAVVKTGNESLAKRHSLFTTIGQLQASAARANAQAASREAINLASQTTAVEGVGAGWAKLNEQIKASKATGELGAMRAGWTRLAGGIGIATTAVGTFMNALGPWMMLIGLAVTAISFLVDHFSNTAKEAKKTSESLQSLEGSLGNVSRTMNAISAKDPFAYFTVQAIDARATALKELADTVQSVVVNSFKELDKMNELDRFINKVKGIFGKDVQTSMVNGLSSGIVEAVKVAEDTGALDSFKKLVKDTLNIDSLDVSSINKAFSEMSSDVAKQKIPLITKALLEVSKQASITAAKGTELKQAFGDASKVFKDLANTYLPTDNVSKLGTAMVESALKLDLALQDPTQTLNAMREVTKDISNLSLFPPATAGELVSLTDKIQDMANAMSAAKRVIKDNENDISSLTARASELKDALGGSGFLAGLQQGLTGPRDGNNIAKMSAELSEIEEKIKNINSVSRIKTSVVAQITTETDALKTVFKEAVFNQMKAGAELVGSRIAAEWQKATSAVNSAVAGLLGDSLAGVRLKAQNDRELIDAQAASIKVQLDLITSQEKLGIQLELSRIAAEKANMDPRDIRLGGLAEREKGLELRSSYLSGGVTKGSSAKLAAELADGVAGAKEALAFVQRVESTLAQVAILAGQRVAIAITEQAGVIKATAKIEKESLDNSKALNDAKLSELSTLEQIGEKLSIEQEASKVTLINSNLDLESKKQLKDLDTEIAIKRLAMANTQSAATKLSIQADIDRLNAQDRINISAKTQAEINKNNAVLEEKRAKRVRDIADGYAEIANILANDAFTKRSSDLEVSQQRLETAKQIENVSESQYILEKQSLELSSLKLDSEKKIYELQQSGVKKFQELTDKYQKENDTDKKALITAEIRAQAQILQTQIDGVNNITSAKLDGINKVAAYELKNTSLYNGLADAVYVNLTEGGAAGGKVMRDTIAKELRKPFNIIIKALIEPVVAGLSRLFDNFLSSFTADLASGITTGFQNILPFLADALKGAMSNPVDSIMKIFDAGKNVFDTFGSATSELGNVFSSAKELISGNATLAKSLGTTAGSQQTSMLAAQEAGMAGSSGATLGGLAKSGMGLVGSFMGARAIGKAVSGGYSAGGTTGNRAVNIGAVVGSLIPGLGTILGGAIGGLVNRVFGKKVTNVGQGVVGTFGGERGFEGQNFSETRTKRLFRRARYSTSYSAMDEGARAGLGEAFIGMRDKTAELAKSLGIGTDSITSFTKNIRIDLKGLSEDQIAKRFSDELAVMQESMAQLALGTTAYNRDGETSLDTLQRLSTNLKATNIVFDQLGQTVSETSLNGALAAQDFVDAFGSLDAFIQSTGFFYDKFFTDAYKATKTTEQLTKAFGDYGIELPKTREGFVEIVSELQKAGDTEAYAALLNLAPALDSILPPLENLEQASTALAAKLKESTKSLSDQILALTKSESELKGIGRADTLSQTDPALLSMQQYVYALEDVKTATDKLKEAQTAEANALREQQNTLKSSITALSQYSTSLKKFKESLLLDSLSPLTPAQKYAEAKSQFDAILSTATGTAATPAEEKAKQAALGQLESASRSFLDASKTYNASSEKYTQDFTKVQNALTDTTSSIDTQLSIEERTYALNEEQISVLTTINTSVLSITDAITNLNAAQANEAIAKAKAFTPGTSEDMAAKAKELLSQNSNMSYSDLMAESYTKFKIDPAAMSSAFSPEDFKRVRGFASGGLASGISMVGEAGRELVDFSTPGRVYTNEQTEGMFTGGSKLVEVVQELRQLRLEVTQLRTQQQTETGHLITATYDAQSRNAEEVAKAVVDSANKQVWTAKVKESVKLT
jgi:hypothetical protein